MMEFEHNVFSIKLQYACIVYNLYCFGLKAMQISILVSHCCPHPVQPLVPLQCSLLLCNASHVSFLLIIWAVPGSHALKIITARPIEIGKTADEKLIY